MRARDVGVRHDQRENPNQHGHQSAGRPRRLRLDPVDAQPAGLDAAKEAGGQPGHNASDDEDDGDGEEARDGTQSAAGELGHEVAQPDAELVAPGLAVGKLHQDETEPEIAESQAETSAQPLDGGADDDLQIRPQVDAPKIDLGAAGDSREPGTEVPATLLDGPEREHQRRRGGERQANATGQDRQSALLDPGAQGRGETLRRGLRHLGQRLRNLRVEVLRQECEERSLAEPDRVAVDSAHSLRHGRDDRAELTMLEPGNPFRRPLNAELRRQRVNPGAQGDDRLVPDGELNGLRGRGIQVDRGGRCRWLRARGRRHGEHRHHHEAEEHRGIAPGSTRRQAAGQDGRHLAQRHLPEAAMRSSKIALADSPCRAA